MTIAPVDTGISIADLVRDPYPIYARLRAEAPVLKVAAVNRIFLTKAADSKAVKDDPVTFSSNDPNTPMRRAFLAHTLMRKDGAEHMRERMAMAPAYSAHVITQHWMPIYEKIADDFVGGLARGETVDLFHALAAPFAARCLAQLLGLPDATDDEMIRWSQTLIDGAGNFGWDDAPFAASDIANAEMDAHFDAFIPWEVTLPLKMSELTTHHSGFASKPGLYTATFVMTMNKDSYAALPDDLKAVIDANSGPDVSALFGAAMDAADVIGRNVATQAGNTITELDGEKELWLAAGAEVTADWIAKMDAKGLDGAALVQSAKDFIAQNAD